jgi:predicted AlkP superfamily pyrophosphatase or phosphodiesterase
MLPLLLLLAACHARGVPAPSQARTPPGPIKHVILVTIDGLLPQSYLQPQAHGLAVPTLRAMKAGGAWSAGARSVYPAITLPSHTTMVTGREPGEHGINANIAFDPLEKNHEALKYYAEDIAVPTLWDLAEQAGDRVAIANWPVTVGAHAQFLIPEVWPSEVTAEDIKLERALSTPGVFERVERRFPGFLARVGTARKDAATTDAAITAILEERPALLLTHLWELDDHQHEEGVWSPPAIAAIENADAQLARLIAACQEAGIWNATALVLLSDHGFTTYSKRVRPGVRFPGAGLVTLSGAEVTDWRAAFLGTGGQGYVYLKDPADSSARDAALALFRELAAHPTETGIAKVRLPEEIHALGGDPKAAFAIEAADGWALARGYRGELTEALPRPHGHHGYDPGRADMSASMIFYGPPIAHGELTDARLLDVAPTVAGFLSLPLSASGHPLAVPLTP